MLHRTMQPHHSLPWEDFKRITLCSYELIHKKLAAAIAYPIIRETYIVPLEQSARLARAFFPTNEIDRGDLPNQVLNGISQLQKAGLRDWQEYIQATNTREKLTDFIGATSIPFHLNLTLYHYLLRYGIPFYFPSLHLVDAGNPTELAWHEHIKQHKLLHNFDLLQHGALPRQREWLANRVGLPQHAIDTLVHRADLARLPNVRQRTVIAFTNSGIHSLEKLANSSREATTQALQAYYANQPGKSWDEMRKVITLGPFVTWAKAIPRIVE